MLSKNQIFIHIPKTGGTTLNCLFFGEETPINPNYNYRHIVYETKMSNSGDIFNPLKNDAYLNTQIVMMLRHPIDRIISEYYFLKDRSEFFDQIKPTPKSFKDYVNSKQTFNYNISFLLGKKIYSNDVVNEEDLKMVINAIEKLNIKIGINEHFEESLQFFAHYLNLKLPNKIHSKRITLQRPAKDEISPDLCKTILANNALDLKLYEYALDKFKSLPKKNVNFNIVKNKLDYAVVYSNRFSLLEAYMQNKDFLNFNQLFFKSLSESLNKAKINDSFQYVKLYALETLTALQIAYPNLNFSIAIDEINKTNDPLKCIETIAKNIDNTVIKTKLLKNDNFEWLKTYQKSWLKNAFTHFFSKQ